jgi:hypothetical protein
MSDLGEHQGRPIIDTAVIVRKTGDGLSKAMQAEPRDIRVGDEVYLLVEAKCIDVHYPAEDRKYPDLGGLHYVVVLDAGTATFLDPTAAVGAIARQKELNRRYADEAAGRLTISDAILEAEHNDGRHKKLVAGCVDCDRERELAALEAEEAKALEAGE